MRLKKEQQIKLAKAEAFAQEVAKLIRGGEILALLGPLGAGKTTFVKALAKSLKAKTKVTSPTFTIMHRHGVRLGHKKIYLYHLDLYRINSVKEFMGLGVQEFWGQPDTVTAIEWADKIKKYWPKGVYVIKFSH